MSNKNTGRMRRYFPDFLVENVDGTRILVEIKPKRKLNQRIVMKKALAAKTWCEKNNMTFLFVTEIDICEYKWTLELKLDHVINNLNDA
jgi:hypothetical protein